MAERQVITKSVGKTAASGSGEAIRCHFDYSILDVGDWYIVAGRAFYKPARHSVARNPIAKGMQFDWQEIEPRVWRVTRTE